MVIMCAGIEYSKENQTKRVYFPNPYAELPILLKNGELAYCAWGRRESQNGDLPLGGWARHESIGQGIWDKWFPKPVKIIVDAFMEKDINSKSHWFPLTKGNFIQGLLARNGKERRVYIVTIESKLEDHLYDRWPRIMLNSPTVR